MSQLAANKGSKLFRALGIIAIIGVVIAVGRLVFKGIKSARSAPEDEHDGI
jgi:hypothetical protein